MNKKFSLLDWVIGLQGFYYLITGLWPFIHLDSFIAVTGPKDSIFLLHMVAALIVVIAITLLASLRNKKNHTVFILAVGAPLAFMFIEILYRAQISWVYFLDFGVEAIIVAALLYSYFKDKSNATATPDEKDDSKLSGQNEEDNK